MINQQQQLNKYLENAVQTASPSQLLIMLYDGAIRFCRQSIQELERKDFSSASYHIGKVQDIISEFIVTLDRKSPIAEGLLKLYDYFRNLLNQANIKKDAAPIQEVVQHLVEMKAMWVEAAMLAKAAGAGAKHG